MGGLADNLRRARRLPGPPCSVRLTLELLDGDDRAALEAALADPTYSTAAIADAVERTGIENVLISEWTIGRHRRGDCACRRLA